MLFRSQPIESVGIGLALSVASSALNGGLAWVMLRASRTHRSAALDADARHLITDVRTSAGVVVGIACVTETDQLLLVTEAGQVIRMTTDMRPIGRDTQGVRLIDLAEGDRVVSIAALSEPETDGDPSAEPGEPDEPPTTPDTPAAE